MPDIRGDGSILPYTAQWQDLKNKFKGMSALDSGIQAIYRRGGNDTERGMWAHDTFTTKSRAVRPLRKRSDPATCTTNYKLARRHFVVKMGDPSGGMRHWNCGSLSVVLSVRGVVGAERGGNIG